jgi:hypothetical protein
MAYMGKVLNGREGSVTREWSTLVPWCTWVKLHTDSPKNYGKLRRVWKLNVILLIGSNKKSHKKLGSKVTWNETQQNIRDLADTVLRGKI